MDLQQGIVERFGDDDGTWIGSPRRPPPPAARASRLST
jgi:hypothetical protein